MSHVGCGLIVTARYHVDENKDDRGGGILVGES